MPPLIAKDVQRKVNWFLQSVCDVELLYTSDAVNRLIEHAWNLSLVMLTTEMI